MADQVPAVAEGNAAPAVEASPPVAPAPAPAANTAPKPDSGLSALVLVANFHQVACEMAQLTHELGVGQRATTATDVVRAAKMLGLKSRLLTGQKVRRLAKLPLPAILQLKDDRFVVIGRRLEDGTLRVIDGATREVKLEKETEFAESWNGVIIPIARRVKLSEAPAQFGLGWFKPSLYRYRKPLMTVVMASLFVQLVGLITPLFFQIVIDKVLVHKGYSTLIMVAVGLVVLGLFQVFLQQFRTYVLSHTTSRIDVELGAKLFDHLLRLPLGYFETRATGQTVARMREMESIRSFLTGPALTSALDLVFTIIFIVVLFLYSVPLAIVVCLSIPCYMLVAFLLRPILQSQTIERFHRGAISQQFLVESVVGMQTIKALAIEPNLKNQWEERLAGYVRASFDNVMLANLGQNLIQFIQKVTSVLVLYLGAYAVINGDMTVGALIAFNMIMGQVTAPILRLSQLWQDFQQVKVSVDRLGDVLNSPVESRSLAQAHLPPAKGNIAVKGVTFRYHPGMPEVLNNVTIEIPAGQVVGIVGPSGSGKSTFTKLLQRLYIPERGQVLVDGIDIAQVDPAWLRRQIGVVLQENLLFNRTVHDNIALANPGMSRAHVMAVARLAGADEFINKLPLGYDTVIEERGANLSGGQRQRLAIARALATNPRILIFDEATSALDYESERIIQDNMQHIVRGRTVIIIAHRLAAVRNCDRIIAIQQGQIVEDGTHVELLEKPTSVYGKLWRMQSDVTVAA
jgi:subfamily B ATP-binding cassette protein HlyB/CyaB